MKRWLVKSGAALEQALSAHPRLGVLAWVGGLTLLAALCALRVASGAEFAFASLALLPVMWSAWVSGRAAGWVMALLASVTWVAGDLASERDFPWSWVPWLNGVIHGTMYLLVATVSAELRDMLRREHERATRDDLTGLLNRRHFLELGNAEVARATRHHHALVMVFLDVDGFKQLNDRQGHQAGDDALRALARALRRSARETDHVARLGGDEFGVMLVEAEQSDSFAAVRRLARMANAALRGFPRLSASVGAARFASPPPGVIDMLQLADRLMYRAKQRKPGSLVVEDIPSAARRTH